MGFLFLLGSSVVTVEQLSVFLHASVCTSRFGSREKQLFTSLREFGTHITVATTRLGCL